MMSFQFLSDLFVPAKLSFSHNLVDYLLNLNNNNLIGNNKDMILDKIKELIKREDIFSIAKLEYEKKQTRFIKNTLWTENKIDQIFYTLDLQFKGVPSKDIRYAIDNDNRNEFLDLLDKCVKIINTDIIYCKRRTEFILDEWSKINKSLMDKLRSFEFKGVKKASNNLRVKILPLISEYKSNLKKNLIEGVISRVEIDETIQIWVKWVVEDIYGELTVSQINMLENLNPNLNSEELISYISDEDRRKDLIYLLQTDKIVITMEKIIDDLI